MNANQLKKIILDAHTNFRKDVFFNLIKNNFSTFKNKLSNKKMLIIGGAGSIGSEFTRLITQYHLKEICIIDVSENQTTDLIRSIRYLYPEIKTNFVNYCCDINNQDIIKVLRKSSFDFIFNFAALKHVRTESNIYNIKKMVETNVLVIDSIGKIIDKKKSTNVLIMSTDKAANPENIMGATKRWMEKRAVLLSNDLTSIKCVRFGNIVLSEGSYSSYMYNQILNKQTFPVPFNIRRFFYSKLDAASICLIVSLLGKNKKIYFPDTKNIESIEIKKIVESTLNKLKYKIKYSKSIVKSKNIFSANLKKKIWTCVKSLPDTTGEKTKEVFHTQTEKVFSDFNNLLNYSDLPYYNNDFKIKEKQLFRYLNSENINKHKLVNLLKKLIKTFSYFEKNNSLNNKF